MILPLLAAFLIAGQQPCTVNQNSPDPAADIFDCSDQPGAFWDYAQCAKHGDNGCVRAKAQLERQKHGKGITAPQIRCDDGKMCRNDVEPWRCVCMPTSVSAILDSTSMWSNRQQPCAGGAPPKNAPDCIPVQEFIQKSGTLPAGPERLKCGKYQHVEHSGPNDGGGTTQCIDDVPLKCDKYQYATIGMKDGYYREVCVEQSHVVTEREWQELMEHIRWIDHIRKEQCPSLSWINGRCIPSCKDDPNGSCKPDPPKEQRK